jgi:hypothetical protein
MLRPSTEVSRTLEDTARARGPERPATASASTRRANSAFVMFSAARRARALSTAGYMFRLVLFMT